MSVAPSITNQTHKKRKLTSLTAWLIALMALPPAIWIAYQAERHIVTHTGPGGPRTPRFGTIYFDAILGPQATDGGGCRKEDYDRCDFDRFEPTTTEGEIFQTDPECRVFLANIKARVLPVFKTGNYYDVWLAERCKTRLSGIPFSSWQQAEEITLEEYL